MNKFQKQLLAIFGKLNLTKKAKDGTMTKEEWESAFTSYKEQYGTDLTADMEEAERLRATQQQHQQIIQALNEVEEEPTAQEETEESDGKKPESKIPAINVVETVKNLIKSNKELKEENETLSKTATPDVPQAIIQTQTPIGFYGPDNSGKYLFGITNTIFSMDKRWNKIAENPNYAKINPVDEETDAPAFKSAALEYGRSLAKRYQYLQSKKALNPDQLAQYGFGTTDLKDAGLGDQYMIRRQDALLARLLTYRTVSEYFPLRYGIQDREMITNAYFDQVSQAYQRGRVFKGDMKLQPEFGYVDDAMTKLEFGPMEEIERKYIGYLNTDGSDNMKWSMIEFILINTYEVMFQEQNLRRIMGIYFKPETGIPGHFLNASTGILYTLVRYHHENKLLLHSDTSYANYDETNMLPAVKEFVKDVKKSIPVNQTVKGRSLYLNENHQTWWMENIRQQYGTQTDFTGPKSYLYVVPDTTIPIIWLPNLGHLPVMFMQNPGNLELLEYIPGEMFKMKFYEDLEELTGMSRWKEGAGASYVGPTFKSREELLANKYRLQQIFMNKPSTKVAPDETTIEYDQEKSFWFITSENTQETIITDINNAEAGIGYIIECGSETNASKIKKTGKFETIISDWTPVKAGDYIMLVVNSEGKFLELERSVDGIRIINEKLQPNVPGAR